MPLYTKAESMLMISILCPRSLHWRASQRAKLLLPTPVGPTMDKTLLDMRSKGFNVGALDFQGLLYARGFHRHRWHRVAR